MQGGFGGTQGVADWRRETLQALVAALTAALEVCSPDLVEALPDHPGRRSRVLRIRVISAVAAGGGRLPRPQALHRPARRVPVPRRATWRRASGLHGDSLRSDRHRADRPPRSSHAPPSHCVGAAAKIGVGEVGLGGDPRPPQDWSPSRWRCAAWPPANLPSEVVPGQIDVRDPCSPGRGSSSSHSLLSIGRGGHSSPASGTRGQNIGLRCGSKDRRTTCAGSAYCPYAPQCDAATRWHGLCTHFGIGAPPQRRRSGRRSWSPCDQRRTLGATPTGVICPLGGSSCPTRRALLAAGALAPVLAVARWPTGRTRCPTTPWRRTWVSPTARLAAKEPPASTSTARPIVTRSVPAVKRQPPAPVASLSLPALTPRSSPRRGRLGQELCDRRGVLLEHARLRDPAVAHPVDADGRQVDRSVAVWGLSPLPPEDDHVLAGVQHLSVERPECPAFLEGSPGCLVGVRVAFRPLQPGVGSSVGEGLRLVDHDSGA